MWVRSLADADAATCGGKAAALARLIAIGLPVPDGFVIEDTAFRAIAGELAAERDAIGHALEHAAERIASAELPAELVAEVERRAAALGTLAVRSSAAIEDAATGSAAGVFSSVTGVAPRDVWSAIRAVWTSALTPLAAAYARGRPLAIAVIVQRFVPGDRVTIYTRRPGEPRGTTIEAQRGEYVRDYARDDVDPLVALALRAEHAIGARDGADVELVETRDGTPWLVQARPIVHPPPVVELVPPPPIVLAALVADGRRWTWDIAHNPDPLSPAQAGLVERVERAQIAPWSMRVCGGYLYTTGSAPRVPIDDLPARAAAAEAKIATLLDGDEPSLADAIDRYLAVYAIWARDIVPLIASARAAAPGAIGARPSSVEATLLAAARGDIDDATAIDRLAPLSTAWDVAVPTFGERPQVIRDAIARARAIPVQPADMQLETGAKPDVSFTVQHPDTRLETGARPQFSQPPDTPDTASFLDVVADLAERDDVWFARAQAMVRFALLRRAAELGIDPGDICWISLEEAATGLSPEDAHRKASAARAAYERARKWAMPLVINGEEVARPTLHGYGSGARVSGRVVRFASLASAVAVTRGDVIVTRAITPALAVFVVGCAAIVSETGGPLDHGAAIARELGIPFVVGCKDAWSTLRDGATITIDGDRVIV